MTQSSMEKTKVGIFDDPQIRLLNKDPVFVNYINKHKNLGLHLLRLEIFVATKKLKTMF